MFEALKGALAGAALAANVLLICLAMLPVALVKLALPLPAVRRATDRVLNALASAWVRGNSAWMAAVGHTRWDVTGTEGLRRDQWYIVVSNHQSWVDILVLQHIFSGRVPFLKFFLKRELFYVPVIGLAWWALDFPFMQRRGAPSNRADLERARRACEKFRLVPTSVINFLEGTRFTRAKHDQQDSPYRHLLKPKVGGIATALATLGSRCHALLDVTIVYPRGAPRFRDLLCGRLHEVVVRVEQRPIPTGLLEGDYEADPGFRERMQRWINALWADKDRLIAELARAPRAAAG